MTEQQWLETIARVLIDCHERGINTAECIARRMEIELSNIMDTEEFCRIYDSYARINRDRKPLSRHE